MSKKFLILLFLIPFQLMFAQKSLLKDFPEGYTPEEIAFHNACTIFMFFRQALKQLRHTGSHPAISTLFFI